VIVNHLNIAEFQFAFVAFSLELFLFRETLFRLALPCRQAPSTYLSLALRYVVRASRNHENKFGRYHLASPRNRYFLGTIRTSPKPVLQYGVLVAGAPALHASELIEDSYP